MTSRPLSTNRRIDAQPTAAVHRRSTLETELLVLVATLTATLATAWVVSQPLLGLATLAGLASLLVLAVLRPAAPSLPRPARLWRLAARTRQ